MAARIRTAMNLYVFGALGAFLLAAPWTPIWDHATLSLAPTSVGVWVRSGWLRGAVSGIGVLDLLVAWVEAGDLWRGLRGRRDRREP